MAQFISVHIISKENTNLGREFLKACFNSLLQAYYPDEIIFVDNGNAPFIQDFVRSFVPQFKQNECELKIISAPHITNFTELRNLCLHHTNPKTAYWHWIDTDEAYYPEDLMLLKNDIIGDNTTCKQYWSYFYHHMITPFMVQDKCSKDNIFRYTKNVHWYGGVHEHVAGLPDGEVGQTEVEYLHYGYCRQQWRTCVKWLHYDWIEHGHLNGYRLENEEEPQTKRIIQRPWFRDWRVPTNILRDRLTLCKPYPNTLATKRHIPDSAWQLIEPSFKYLQNVPSPSPAGYFEWLQTNVTPQLSPSGELVNETAKDVCAAWSAYLDVLDPADSSFWGRWLEEYKRVGTGNWGDTLGWVADEMNKTGWNCV